MSDLISLGPGGEFDRIRAIWRRLGDRVQGAGDDCALLAIGGERVAMSIDVSVEHEHFETGWMSLEEIGYRSAAASLSDLAAVAAEPVAVLVSLGVPKELPFDAAPDLMEGVGRAAHAVGANVAGGDLVKSDRIIVDVAVVGRMVARALSRRGARPGDGLWVTGRLGGPGAALAAWKAGQEPEASARARFANPVPRVREAAWLRDHGATAAMDLSDGLLPDARHLSAASAVACEVDLDRIPLHPACLDPLDALVSGEEYELLVALPGDFGEAAAFARELDLDLTRVGSVKPGAGLTLWRGGRTIEVPRGFKHF
jgi:thiamine-monophosphate kinase